MHGAAARPEYRMNSVAGAKTLKVRILGAGVAGLATGLALSRRLGLSDIKIFERDPAQPSIGRTGHGLLLMQNGVKALRALDADRHPRRLHGPEARDHSRQHRDGPCTSRRFDDVYCVTRAALIDGTDSGPPGDAVDLRQPVREGGRGDRGTAAQSGPGPCRTVSRTRPLLRADIGPADRCRRRPVGRLRRRSIRASSGR